jgi:peptidoglycan/xylan/chitin deacetylase (PgdA/CDA1 family)
VESGDQTAEVMPAEYICERIVNGARGLEQAIILMHDSPGPKTTPDALRLAIPRLREQGFVFERLTSGVTE